MLSERQAPSDCVLMPLRRGKLLVSRTQATYCAISPEDEPALMQCLAKQTPWESLPPGILESLEKHGFFDEPRPSPAARRTVQLQLTNACNLACAYCCTNSGRARPKELTLDGWQAVVDEIPEAMGSRVQVAVLGGEPFLLPWAIDLLEYIRQKGLSLTIFSNGMSLASEALAERVAKLIQGGAELRVSLAGPTQASCDEVSGAQRYQRVIEGLTQLARFGARATVDLMLMPQHVGLVAEHLPELRRALPQGTRIAFGVLFHGGRETGERLFASRSELEAALDRITFEAGEIIDATRASALAERREGCSCALGHHMHVRSDGSLFTCFKMEERVGHLSTDRFTEALGKVRSRPAPAQTLAKCQDCPLATLCGGGCRAENLQFTGDPSEPICGPWRVAVLSELLADDWPSALEWPAQHLLQEAKARGIPAPDALTPLIPSRHLLDT